MGHGINITCKYCHQTEIYQLGIGMMDSSLEMVLGYLHYKKRKKVNEILQEHLVNKTKYSNELYHCTKCHGLYGRFYVKIIYDKDQVYETSYNCGKCRVQLERISEDAIAQIPCQKCNRNTLQVSTDILWD